MDFNEFARNLPDWARAGIIVACWGVGFRIGWGLLDRCLERRAERRALALRDVTPR